MRASRLIPESWNTDQLVRNPLIGEGYTVIVMKKCSVEGCNNKKHVKIGYCSKHYEKFKKYGDPLAGRSNIYLPGEAPKLCTVDKCNSVHDHGGLCHAHYLRKKKLGSVDALYDSEKIKLCSVQDCNAKHYCKTFCSKHYQNWFTHGDPLYTEKNSVMGWMKRHIKYESDECLWWPFSRLTNGYPVVQTKDGKRRIASRVMCEIAHGTPPCDSMDAAHSCGNGNLGCVNPKHLRWATRIDNCHDKYDHGTHLYGEKAPWSILTEDDVRYILDKEKSGGPTALAEKFGVSKWAIYSIRQRRTWRHVEL